MHLKGQMAYIYCPLVWTINVGVIVIVLGVNRLWVNPNSLSSPFPLPRSFARSRESKDCPNSPFDRGVGLRGRGRYPLKPRIFASLFETKGYPEHTFEIIQRVFSAQIICLKLRQSCFVLYTVL